MRQALSIVALALAARLSAAAEDSFAVALQERIPALLATNHVPGVVISYITNGAVSWTKAFGQANVRKCTPMRPDMVFNHGSDGKVLTAWGIMRLVEKGKVVLGRGHRSGSRTLGAGIRHFPHYARHIPRCSSIPHASSPLGS